MLRGNRLMSRRKGRRRPSSTRTRTEIYVFGRGEITTKGTIVDCQTHFRGPQDGPRSEIIVDVQSSEGQVERVSFKQELNNAGYLTPSAGDVVTSSGTRSATRRASTCAGTLGSTTTWSRSASKRSSTPRRKPRLAPRRVAGADLGLVTARFVELPVRVTEVQPTRLDVPPRTRARRPDWCHPRAPRPARRFGPYVPECRRFWRRPLELGPVARPERARARSGLLGPGRNGG